MTDPTSSPSIRQDIAAAKLERAMARHHYAGDSLIEILHVAQQLYGSLSKPLLETVARRLKLPFSKVLGVATFYHLFRLVPSKAHTAAVCMGTACYVAGSGKLLKRLRQGPGAADPAQWTVEAGRCLGSCGLAPVVVCDGECLSRVRPEDLESRLKL